MPGVLVIDSGVNSHPLLKDAIGGRTTHPTAAKGVKADWSIDDVGHGTSVAGRALYGNIESQHAPGTLPPASLDLFGQSHVRLPWLSHL